jgi:DNA-binding MarR family transcriptional regulator
MSRETKANLIEAVIASFRANSSQESAFDALAAERLGIGLTDLRCLDIVEGRGGVTAGELAVASGLTTGAVTAVIDRLERAGFARRVRDDADRRKVNVEVTALHYERSREIWGPLMADWQRVLGGRFTAAELRTVTEFLDATAELAATHGERVRGLPPRT